MGKSISQKINKEYRNKKGQLHREDGPAIELADGYKAYWVNGKLHREDGPAIEWADGSKEYWVNSKLHREDGPAVEYANGYKAYWVNGRHMSKQDFKNRKKPKSPNNISSTGTQDFKYELKEQIRSIIKSSLTEKKDITTQIRKPYYKLSDGRYAIEAIIGDLVSETGDQELLIAFKKVGQAIDNFHSILDKKYNWDEKK